MSARIGAASVPLWTDEPLAAVGAKRCDRVSMIQGGATALDSPTAETSVGD
jgi:hypothetical protein